jgi:hypothetical protein
MYLVCFVEYTSPGNALRASINSSKVRNQAFIKDVIDSLPELKQPMPQVPLGEDVEEEDDEEDEL